MTPVLPGIPKLSIILVTDRFATVARVVDAFVAQTMKRALELVIVLPSDVAHEVDETRLDGFAAHCIVARPSILPMCSARAAGVRAATAPVIFIGETHSFPQPDFAEAIIAAHEGPWDVVVPGLDNANPRTAKSWAGFLLDYGYWLDTLPASMIGSGPTWNTSYKKDALLELGEMLDGALTSGDELPLALRALHRRVYFEPAAKIGHVNLESHGWLDERFLSGVVVGANRRKRWSRWRRAAYFVASPLIPFVLLYRNVASVRYLNAHRRLPAATFPALLLGVTARTAGEALGYISGLAPHAESRMDDYELNKLRYVSI